MTEELEKLLNHSNVEIRRQAVKDIRKSGKDMPVVISYLIKAVEDEDWRVRKTAVEVLLDIRGDEVIEAVIKNMYSEDNANARNSAIEILTALGSEATDHLVEVYTDAAPDVKKFIIDILGDSGDMKAVPLLLRALEDEDDNVRTAAVDYLGNIQGNPSVLNALIDILKSGDMWVAYTAAAALGRIGDMEAVDALVSMLSRKELKKPIIKALGLIAKPDTLPLIIPFLKDKSSAVREEAVIAVEHFLQKGLPEETIVKELRDILGKDASGIVLPYTLSKKKEVRIAAILLLGLLKDKGAIPSLLEIAIEEDFYEIVVKALIFIGRSIPEALIPFFTVEDSYQRRIVCEVAGRIGDSAFFNHLVKLLKDEDGHVRGNAAAALSNLNNSEAVPHILPLLLDEYENIQEESIKALSRLERWLDIDEIIKGLSSSDRVLKRNTAQLLGLLRDQRASDALGRALKDSDARVRVSVAEALGAIEGAGAVKYLLTVLTDDSAEVRRVSAIMIGRMRAKAGVEPLILLLRDSDLWVRAAAAVALGNIGNEKAIDPMIGLLSDESGFVRAANIEALGNFKVNKVKKTLLKLLNDMDAEIRSTAVGALANFDGIAQDIIPLLKNKEWSVRKKVVDVLGTFFKAESYAYIKEVAALDEDAQVRETAARYLSV